MKKVRFQPGLSLCLVLTPVVSGASMRTWIWVELVEAFYHMKVLSAWFMIQYANLDLSWIFEPIRIEH